MRNPPLRGSVGLMIPCPRVPVFMESQWAADARISVLVGKFEGALEAFHHSPPTVEGQRDVSLHRAGTLFWLDLESYDEIIGELDEWCGPLRARRLGEAETEEACCPVRCWVYQAIPQTGRPQNTVRK